MGWQVPKCQPLKPSRAACTGRACWGSPMRHSQGRVAQIACPHQRPSPEKLDFSLAAGVCVARVSLFCIQAGLRWALLHSSGREKASPESSSLLNVNNSLLGPGTEIRARASGRQPRCDFSPLKSITLTGRASSGGPRPQRCPLSLHEGQGIFSPGPSLVGSAPGGD